MTPSAISGSCGCADSHSQYGKPSNSTTLSNSACHHEHAIRPRWHLQQDDRSNKRYLKARIDWMLPPVCPTKGFKPPVGGGSASVRLKASRRSGCPDVARTQKRHRMLPRSCWSRTERRGRHPASLGRLHHAGVADSPQEKRMLCRHFQSGETRGRQRLRQDGENLRSMMTPFLLLRVTSCLNGASINARKGTVVPTPFRNANRRLGTRPFCHLGAGGLAPPALSLVAYRALRSSVA